MILKKNTKSDEDLVIKTKIGKFKRDLDDFNSDRVFNWKLKNRPPTDDIKTIRSSHSYPQSSCPPSKEPTQRYSQLPSHSLIPPRPPPLMSLSIPLRNSQCSQPCAKVHKSPFKKTPNSKTSHLLADLNRFYNRPPYTGKSISAATLASESASIFVSETMPVATSYGVGSSTSIDPSRMSMPEGANVETMDTQPINIDGPSSTMHLSASGLQDTSLVLTIHSSFPLHTSPSLSPLSINPTSTSRNLPTEVPETIKIFNLSSRKLYCRHQSA